MISGQARNALVQRWWRSRYLWCSNTSFWNHLILNDYERSTRSLVWLISRIPLLHWNKSSLLKDFSIQPSFKTNARFFWLFHRLNFQLFNKFALRHQNSGRLCLLWYCYNIFRTPVIVQMASWGDMFTYRDTSCTNSIILHNEDGSTFKKLRYDWPLIVLYYSYSHHISTYISPSEIE